MRKIGLLFLILAVTGLSQCKIVWAQEVANGVGTEAFTAATTDNAGNMPQIPVVDAASVAALPSLLPQVDAVSLQATRAQLEENPASLAALIGWIRAGGVAFLHNDAAQVFGYRTIRARAGTAQLAGQLFGRAVAALPFGSHPLLWGNVDSGERGAGAINRSVGGADNDAGNGDTNDETAEGADFENVSADREAPNALGVRTVFYQVQDGDHLVVEHPAGVPLLRVTDLAAPSKSPLYAAAIAPYGNGWVVFTPALVERERADGALFLDNLNQFVESARAARQAAGNNLYTGSGLVEGALASLSAEVIEQEATLARNGALTEANLVTLNQEAARALQFAPVTPATAPDAVTTSDEAPRDDAIDNVDQDAPQQDEMPAVVDGQNLEEQNMNADDRDDLDQGVGTQVTAQPLTVEEAPRLLVLRSELMALAAWANAARNDETARDNVEAALALLRARLAMQRGNRQQAVDWLDVAEDMAPEAAEILLWRGIFDAGQAEDLSLSSQERAQLLDDAVAQWRDALTARLILAPTNDSAGRTGISGVPVALVRSWSEAASSAARLLSAEPPLVTILGNSENPIYLRHFANDQTLRLAIPTAEALARSHESLGWRLDETEILIFPTEEYFTTYRSLAGLGSQAVMNPAQQFADASGNRIYMLSQVSLPIFLPSATPGGSPRPVQLGTSVTPVMARLQSQAMIAALTEGGNDVPEWMQIGLMALNNLNVVAEVSSTDASTDALRQLATNRLLTPHQYRGIVFQGETASIAEAQALSLMMFFYNEYGPGRVVETLQRLGSGESVDEALQATTELTEEEFFTAWHDDLFGGR